MRYLIFRLLQIPDDSIGARVSPFVLIFCEKSIVSTRDHLWTFGETDPIWESATP